MVSNYYRSPIPPRLIMIVKSEEKAGFKKNVDFKMVMFTSFSTDNSHRLTNIKSLSIQFGGEREREKENIYG